MKTHTVLKNALTKSQYKLIKKEILKQRGVLFLKILNMPYDINTSIRGLFIFKDTKRGHTYYYDFIFNKCNEYYKKAQK